MSGNGTQEVPATRATRQRSALLELLQQSGDYYSARELHAILRGRGEAISLPTVYRALQFFLERGSIQVLHTVDGGTRYRRCARPGGHLHLICRLCGHTEEIAGYTLEDEAAHAAQNYGFTDLSSTAEIFGICHRCPGPDAAAAGHQPRPASGGKPSN